MEDLSLHILDIAENSIAAGAQMLRIILDEDPAADLLTIEIRDDGKGMTPEIAAQAADPFFTTKPDGKAGLGLALLREASSAAEGKLTITSSPHSGTTVKATFRLSNSHAKPVGNMAETITSLLAAHTGLDIVYQHKRSGHSLVFETSLIRLQVDGAPLDSVGALNVIRDYLNREEATLTS